MKKAKKKGKNLLQSKEINYNLEQMRKIKLYFYFREIKLFLVYLLREEDQTNRTT